MKKGLLLSVLFLGCMVQKVVAEVPIYVRNMTSYELHTSGGVQLNPGQMVLEKEIQTDARRVFVPIAVLASRHDIKGCHISFHTYDQMIRSGRLLQTVVDVKENNGALVCTAYASEFSNGQLVEGGIVLPLSDMAASYRYDSPVTMEKEPAEASPPPSEARKYDTKREIHDFRWHHNRDRWPWQSSGPVSGDLSAN